MKKLLLITGIVFLLASCQISSPNDTVLVNHSSETVTVNLTGASGITLAPGESRAIETRMDMSLAQRIQSFSPNRRVSARHSNSQLLFEFYDLPYFEMQIFNLTEWNGKLIGDERAGMRTSASEWKENISFNNRLIIAI